MTHITRDFLNKAFKVWSGHTCIATERVVFYTDGLQDHDRSSHVSAGVICNRKCQIRGKLEILAVRYFAQNVANLTFFRRRHPNLQTAGAERLDDLAQTFAVSDDSAARHVCFHGAAEGCLRGQGQLVQLVNHYNLEALLLFRVELLAACDFFNEFLHDYSIVDFSLAWGDLDVVHAAEDDGLARCLRSGAHFEFLALALCLVHGLGAV